MWQFAKSGSRLRGPASIEPSFHCEGVLLLVLFEAQIAPASAAGTAVLTESESHLAIGGHTDVVSQSKCRQLPIERLMVCFQPCAGGRDLELNRPYFMRPFAPTVRGDATDDGRWR